MEIAAFVIALVALLMAVGNSVRISKLESPERTRR